jgi:hypothetical protein
MNRAQSNGPASTAAVSASLDRSADDLAEARARLQQSLEALHLRIDELRDWRAWLRRHPFPFLLAAATLGVLLGARRPDR